MRLIDADAVQNIWEREKPTNKIMEYDEVYGHCPNCGCVVTDLNDIYVGLEPEEVRELATAKNDGRLVVLPCKVGTPVYYVCEGICKWKKIDGCSSYCSGAPYEGCWEEGEPEILEEKFCLEMLDKIGKTIFLTREEAEAAIKGGVNNE